MQVQTFQDNRLFFDFTGVKLVQKVLKRILTQVFNFIEMTRSFLRVYFFKHSSLGCQNAHVDLVYFIMDFDLVKSVCFRTALKCSIVFKTVLCLASFPLITLRFLLGFGKGGKKIQFVILGIVPVWH